MDAVLKEYAQLDDKTIFDPHEGIRISAETKEEVLHLLTLVKEMRDGKAKGRACADDRKQMKYISKEGVASPNYSYKF